MVWFPPVTQHTQCPPSHTSHTAENGDASTGAAQSKHNERGGTSDSATSWESNFTLRCQDWTIDMLDNTEGLAHRTEDVVCAYKERFHSCWCLPERNSYIRAAVCFLLWRTLRTNISTSWLQGAVGSKADIKSQIHCFDRTSPWFCVWGVERQTTGSAAS